MTDRDQQECTQYTFSQFIRYASSAEKKKLYKRVLKQVSIYQQDVIDRAHKQNL